MSSILLKGPRVVLANGEVASTSVLISDGRISKIGPDISAAGAIEIDLTDTTLFPGFIDMHIHGANGVDIMDAGPSDLIDMAKFLASEGVTAWVPTFVPASDETYARAVNVISNAIETRRGASARILGIHYEGPFVNTAQCGALHKDYFKTYHGPIDLESLPIPRTGIKMTTISPEIEGGIELVRALKEKGWIISIGHTRADVEVLDRAFDAGARHMTHFMNAMAPLHHRNPGPIGWGLSRSDVSCDIIADGIHLDPFVLKLLLRIKGSGALSLISDAIAAAGKGDGEYQIWGETISVSNGRTSNSHGSIAGSVISLLDAVKMMRTLGVSDVDIARMASSNPAHVLGIDNECGSIEVGKRADLVAIDANGDVKLTVVGGEVAFRA
jgi:N-acetylglucosamine-6-phosphate deacetylase